MIGAMMLPTTVPVLRIVRRMVAGRADAGRLYALVLAGYLAAWLGFGLVAHALDAALRAAAGGSAWLAAHGWAVGAAVVAGAGLFQFSTLKYRCLDQCRTPLGFVTQRWGGRAPKRDALRIGLHHGLFCVGCCWALMLLMFVVGSANLAWMLLLGVVMALEKNLPGGRRLSAPLGGVLLVWAAAITAGHL